MILDHFSLGDIVWHRTVSYSEEIDSALHGFLIDSASFEVYRTDFDLLNDAYGVGEKVCNAIIGFMDDKGIDSFLLIR